MPTTTRDLYLDLNNGSGSGLLNSFASSAEAGPQIFVLGNRIDVRAHYGVATSDPNAAVPYIADDTGRDCRISISKRNQPATSGWFYLAIEEDGFAESTDPIPYNVSPETLKAEIENTFTNIQGIAQTVTITEVGATTWLIKFDTAGAWVDLQITPHAVDLLPDCVLEAEPLVLGAVGRREVWRLTVKQAGVAWADLTTPLPSYSGTPTLTADHTQVGTALLPSIQTLTFPTIPVGGTATWNYSGAETTKVVCVADVADSLDGKDLDIYKGSVPYRFWYSTNAAAAPAAPADGVLVEIASAAGNPATTNALDLQSAATAAGFTATRDGAVVYITDSTVGARTAASAGTSGFAVSVFSAGCSYSVPLAYDATPEEICEALGSLFTGKLEQSGVYKFTGVTPGARTQITVTTAGLLTPKGRSGTLQFDTYAAAVEFGAVSDESIEFPFSIKIIESGAGTSTPCVRTAEIVRDVP